jgi:HKD family nuclease
VKLRVLTLLLGLVISGMFVAAPAQAAPAQAAPALDQASRAGQWEPPGGAVFNNPYGSPSQRFRIEHRLMQAIKNTPNWGHIRISIYSFDRVDVAKALVRAHKRGVQVQILLNDHQVTRAQRILHRALGRNRHARNFAYECKSSCRGRRDNLHSKFYLFSRTGSATNVVMLGSVNFTMNAVKWQWNDLLTEKNRPGLFKDFVSLFNDMRHDYKRNQPYYTFCGKPKGERCFANRDWMFTRVFPRSSSPTNDAVLNLLKPIQCVYKTKQGKEHTHLRLSMHTMQGARGLYLARRMRQLWANGCDFKVIYGLMGWNVKRELGAVTPRGRIPLRSAGFDYDDDGEVNRYTHQKYFTVSGMYAGKVTNLTFTGSSNWTSRGTSGDEIIFDIHGKGIRAQYEKNWALMWNSDRYTRNAYTTTASDYKTYVATVDLNGRPTATRIVTKTHTIRMNRPDGFRSGGSSWESD